MPYLDSIVSKINEQTIRSLNFVSPGSIRAFGIAETIVEPIDEQRIKRYPAAIDDDGEATMIDFDNYYITIYHRLEGIINAIAPVKNQYGDDKSLTETVNMAMIVLAFRNQIQRTGWQLEATIKDQFLDNTKETDNDGKILQTSMLRVGTSNFDKLILLPREYAEVKFEFQYPELIMFETKYSIQSTYKKGCLNNCVTC
jgi:hypothetical protein